MVYGRLARRRRATGVASFVAYLDALEAGHDRNEWEAFTNALTINLTSFFREAHHFPPLADHLKTCSGKIELWCSASSTGEDPYSMAMTACEVFDTLTPPVDIIATDIDTNVLTTAATGIYTEDRLDKLSPERIQRFFLKGKNEQAGMVRVRQELRQMVSFEQLNLLSSEWPVKGPFDAIFCRNVLIYFDKPAQEKILNRFAPLLKADGILCAGHSENFLYVTDAFKLRGKTVYELASADDNRKRSAPLRD